MIVYNPSSLKELKKQFRINNNELATILNLRSPNSSTKRISNITPLTAREIEILCNYTEERAKNDYRQKLVAFTPTDFYKVIE